MFPQGPRLIYTLHKELGVKVGEMDFLRTAHALKSEETEFNLWRYNS